uniref:Prolyl 4-hydroxylase alpha-subunit N-terminal domain-containing protein n=1 Tax=Syphacia muris TaxID=451379 RepID=A0A0N5ASA6_9BILA
MLVSRLLILLLLVGVVNAGWFDDMMVMARENLQNGVAYVKDAVVRKVNDLKQIAEDPETYRKSRDWFNAVSLFKRLNVIKCLAEYHNVYLSVS